MDQSSRSTGADKWPHPLGRTHWRAAVQRLRTLDATATPQLTKFECTQIVTDESSRRSVVKSIRTVSVSCAPLLLHAAKYFDYLARRVWNFPFCESRILRGEDCMRCLHEDGVLNVGFRSALYKSLEGRQRIASMAVYNVIVGTRCEVLS